MAALAAAAAAASPAGASLVPRGLAETFVLDAAPRAQGEAAAGPEAEAEAAQAPLAPVCALVGGVAANAVLRAVSRVGAPLCNLFLYSLLARDGLGVEETFL